MAASQPELDASRSTPSTLEYALDEFDELDVAAASNGSQATANIGQQKDSVGLLNGKSRDGNYSKKQDNQSDASDGSQNPRKRRTELNPAAGGNDNNNHVGKVKRTRADQVDPSTAVRDITNVDLANHTDKASTNGSAVAKDKVAWNEAKTIADVFGLSDDDAVLMKIYDLMVARSVVDGDRVQSVVDELLVNGGVDSLKAIELQRNGTDIILLMQLSSYIYYSLR